MPIDYGWTPPSQPQPGVPAVPRLPGQPLPGSLNALFSPPPQAAGLVVPGAPSGPVQTPQREMGLGDIGRSVLGMAGQTLDIPRMLAWNAGPALVGRSGQGPQTGADALQRLGLNYDSPVQRAIGHGLGIGLDLVANPMNLVGMGAARGATPAAANLTRRLEQFAGPGLQDATQAASSRLVASAAANGGYARPFATPWGADVLSQARVADPSRVPIAMARPRGGAADLQATVPGGGVAVSPRPIRVAGGPGSVQSFGYDADVMRSLQLNSPNFNPANPVFGLGTGQFTQDASHAARMGLGEYSPLATSRFMSGADVEAPSIIRRLERMTASPPQLSRPTYTIPGPNYSAPGAAPARLTPERSIEDVLRDAARLAEGNPAPSPWRGPSPSLSSSAYGSPTLPNLTSRSPTIYDILNVPRNPGTGDTLLPGRGLTLPPIDY